VKRSFVIVAIIVVLAVAIGVFAYSRSSSKPPEEATTTVRRGTVKPTVSASGSFYPAGRVELSFEQSGTVEEVFVSEGDRVKPGDELARLDSSTLQDAYDQARENLRAARARLSQAIARDNAEIERARSQLSAAQTSRKLAEDNYDDARAAYDAALLTSTSTAQLDQLASALRAAESQLASARAQEEQARIQYNLAVTNAKLDRAQQESQVRLAEQALERARRDLDGAVLTSPIDGVVIQVAIAKGDAVSGRSTGVSATSLQSTTGGSAAGGGTGNPAIIVAPVDWKPEMEFTVDQADIGKVRVGLEAHATLDAFPDIELTGTITEVERYPEAVSGVVSYRVTVAFSSRPDRLLPGMTGTVTIASETQTGLVVPNLAIRYVNGKPTVRVKTDSGFETRTIEVGLSDASNTIVLKGLKEGDRIAVNLAPPSSSGARPRMMFGGSR